MTTVNDVMTRDVRTLTSDSTITEAAKAMEELDVGVIPVCEGDKLLGMVTDRDIVVRAVAQGLDGNTPLAKVMSTDIRTARESDDLDTVLADMASSQIRRLPVLDGAERLVGIISIGDIAVKGQDEEDVGQSLGEISSPA
ncbi:MULTISPECIES: CBS domain-containing protein [unclassified Polaromonas]|jgi:CBS domain-containing protein|uniref:CBS domain-containing protein n=1 Tax=unclassified Polaromonas TaxID=2638319 RepID=UPI000BDD27BF|nr:MULTISPECIES: CBS domain-containing protein [unclassified Polaromonas]OYY33054.1 MAG: CBS domain-containing protein [Polaromonas sp. 35-63-35]OYZ17233.1 MAG: CBS domain-containing protein [Polaromonas sp. 16-63-31]OYZ76484.1 MAG: CBS domain-containing protein [Polaromonas sp. 24-63-21]OZA47570.1 MAG: CBS domain-containing protein [Polaromonas sp. 17-63-33]OZA85651.1 MAG: CBS domain-containing protein [Polaromonas sp. 39-63-25]